MFVLKHHGKVFGARLTKDEQKALDLEVNRQLAERDKAYEADMNALALYVLRVHLGFGKKRLRRFWDAFNAEHKALQEWSLLDGPGDREYLAKRELRKIGVDVEKWATADEDRV